MGRLLRSSLEYDFYSQLLTNGFKDSDFEIDQTYPGSSLGSDFYFPTFDVFIEIAGMTGLDWYDEKMNMKRKNFNCWIVQRNEFHETIQKLKGLKCDQS